MSATKILDGYRFSVPGAPVAKQRPRFTRNGPFVRAFTPSSTASYESQVALFASQAGVEMMGGPLEVHIVCVWPMKGTPRKRKPLPSVWKATRPDIDNLAKSVLDGCQGVAFADDGQVVRLVCEKRHAAQDEPPRTDVTIRPAGEVCA